SPPRFEHDFIIGIKLVPIDSCRCLCVLITDFGEIKTETLYIDNKLSTLSSKRIEAYFNWRLNGQQKPDNLTVEEEEFAKKLYNELLVRYIVGYSQFNENDIYRTGFSALLSHPEFHDPAVLANSLALFENTHGMRLLLKECSKHNTLKLWIGEDLTNLSSQPNHDCSVIAIPFHVNNQPVGAVGLLGPQRLPYRTLFDLLHSFSERVSEALTRNLYKFKITLKPPQAETVDLKKRALIGETRRLLLEDKTTELQIPLPKSLKKKAGRNNP
ncbi:MAG: HrcA family transcriptional regulator, partial [Parachlamydiaceae bacterium]